RKRDVHVVAAEEQMIADGDALERERRAVELRLDEREVGRTAADVDDEDPRGAAERVLPLALVGREPGVERGLRLFQERQRRELRLGRGGDGQLARDLVERRRHGEDDLL